MTRSLAEQETIYRWDADERLVHGWTANRTEAHRWRALGYVVTERPGGWRTQFPVEALALLPMQAGAVQTSRYLDPPVILKASRLRDGQSDRQNSEQKHASGCESPRATDPSWSESGEAA